MGNQRASQTKAPEAKQRANTSSSRQRLPSFQDEGYSMLQLQQTLGNQAVQRFARSCPVFPQRCPFGGACHTCPAKVQTKLKVNEPGDEYEREADAVAEMVMLMPEPPAVRPDEDEEKKLHRKPLAEQITPLVQRQATDDKEDELERQEEEEEEKEAAQAKFASGLSTVLQRHEEKDDELAQTMAIQRQMEEDESAQANLTPNTITQLQRQTEDEEEGQADFENEENFAQPTCAQCRRVNASHLELRAKSKGNGELHTNRAVEARLSHARGGSPLPVETRAFMEPRFGVDFSQVRVHTGSEAVQMSQDLNAQAFTIGKDIYFGNGRYNPQVEGGNHLIAHELVHVVQQKGASTNINKSTTLQKKPKLASTAKSELLGKETKKPYPPINWSIDRAKNRALALPKAGVSLDEIAQFLYGDPSAKTELAAENKIRPGDPLVPGQPLLLPKQPKKKLTQAALQDLNESPKVPLDVADPEAFVAKANTLDKALERDFSSIVKKLDESHYSDSDEEEVISILKKWGEEKFVTRPERYPNGGEYLDKLFSKLMMKTKDIGTITSQWTNYYSMIFNHFDRVNEVIAIRDKYSKEFVGEKGHEELSFGKEVVVKSVVALPGGISAGVGGAMKVLPFDCTEAIGDALVNQGKEYLKAVGYGDEKMIETAIEWSEFSGAFSTEVVMTISGGNIAKVKKIIEMIESGEDFLTLKGQIENVIKLKDEIPQFLMLLKDQEKLLAVVLGIEDDKIVDRLEKWALEASSNGEKDKKKKKAGKKKGVGAVLARIKTIIDRVRQIFQPIFSIRRRIVGFTEKIILIISEIPLFDKLLEMLSDKEKRPKNLAGFLDQFTDLVAQKFLDKLDEVQKFILDFIGKGEEFLNSLAVSAKEVASIITEFSLNTIEKQIKMVKALKAIPEITNLIAERLIKPLVPEEPLNALNQEIKKVTNKIMPVLKFVKDGINYLSSQARQALKQELVPGLKNLFIQPSLRQGATTTHRPSASLMQEAISQSVGESLDDQIRDEMEVKFNKDFGSVRIHHDEQANIVSESIQANAFTTGHDIYFGEGKYRPHDVAGKKLLAHELTHIVQQDKNIQPFTIQRDRAEVLKSISKKLREKVFEDIKRWRGKKKERKSFEGKAEIDYGDLDSEGRPTGMWARLRKPIEDGTPAKFTPKGFDSNKGHARGHLLAKWLGGSGTDPRNIVILFHYPVNDPLMKGYERKVRQAVDDGETVLYKVTPKFTRKERLPKKIKIEATGNKKLRINETIPNKPKF